MEKFSDYSINLKGMAPGVQTYEFHPGKDFIVDMESQDIRDAALDVRLMVTHRDDQWDLHFDIKGELTLLCDRCLDEMSFPIDTVYDLTVKYGPCYCDDSDTVLEIPESDANLNVARMLYDTVALTVPMKHVHPTGGCNSAMSSIYNRHRAYSAEDADEISNGANASDDVSDKPVDPRWEALRGLADNDN